MGIRKFLRPGPRISYSAFHASYILLATLLKENLALLHPIPAAIHLAIL